MSFRGTGHNKLMALHVKECILELQTTQELLGRKQVVKIATNICCRKEIIKMIKESLKCKAMIGY